MAVTAAPARKVTRVRGFRAGKNYGQVSAGKEIDISGNWSLLFHWYDKLIAANHVQARPRGDFNRPRICSQSFHFHFQRLIYVTKRLDVRLHRRELLRCNLNFGARSHVYRHTDGEGRQQNHSKNYPGRNYSAAPAHFSARTEDLDRDLLYRGKGTRAWSHTLSPDSLVNPICICCLAHLNTSQFLCRSDFAQFVVSSSMPMWQR
jgi:hypothetical protein